MSNLKFMIQKHDKILLIINFHKTWQDRNLKIMKLYDKKDREI